MYQFDRQLDHATIVRKRSSPGYRLVLCLKTARGTTMPETIADIFPSPAQARLFAMRDLGLAPSNVKWGAEISQAERL